MTEKAFLTARAAAEIIGCDEAAVVADVKAGYTDMYKLNGGEFGNTHIVYRYELEGDRLAMHQARLRSTVRESDAHG